MDWTPLVELIVICLIVGFIFQAIAGVGDGRPFHGDSTTDAPAFDEKTDENS